MTGPAIDNGLVQVQQPGAEDVVLWRIATAAGTYRANDLSGTGAAIDPGRWNSKGKFVVYAAESRALACLETMIHLDRSNPLPVNRMLVAIKVPAKLIAQAITLTPADVPAFDVYPHALENRTVGDNWLSGRESAILRVPSALVEEEHVVLINPEHPDSAAITAKAIRRWHYDQRLQSPPNSAAA